MKCISLFKCNPQIEVIDKSHCSLEDVPNFQNYSRTLEELFLDANKLIMLNDNVFKLIKLRRFSFSDNAIQDIPPDIAKLVNLVEIDGSRNKIQAIPEQIKFLRGLQICDFSANTIEYLPTGLVQLKNLTCLTLNYCILKCLPDDFGLLKNLESLELRENELESLPPSISGLESLRKLDVGRNLISKLPDDIGRLTKLEYLLVDGNRLETVPSKISRLENLQCLDLGQQEYGLKSLPEGISGLTSLTDLHLSENHLQSLPDGIRNLKNLTIFKADNNYLSELNPNIGGCTALQELVLTSNQISKLPFSLGALTDLRSLNVDSNLLKELPTQIGNLRSMGILSLRDNFLTHLPNEIGNLDLIKVMDLSGNRLEYLPVNITNLNLKALWLSKNQAQPLPKLQIDELSSGTKVLTCYLLPQQSEDSDGSMMDHNDQQVDMENYAANRQAAVSFDTAAVVDDELDSDANFVRHDTPHPRELRERHRKLLNNKVELKGMDNESFVLADQTNNNNQYDPQQQPPSVIKHLEYESNGLPEIETVPQSRPQTGHVQTTSKLFEAFRQKSSEYPAANTTKTRDESNKSAQNVGNGLERWSRHDGDLQPKTLTTRLIEQEPVDCQIFDIAVRRADHHKPGLGLSIAGGKDTPPFKDNDEGIFVSKVTRGGPAEAAGVRTGDKILAVNDNLFYEGITHQKAVEIFKKIKPDFKEFIIRILRDLNDVFIDERQDDGASLKGGTNDTIVTNDVKVAEKSNIGQSTFTRTYTVPIKSESNGSTVNSVNNLKQFLMQNQDRPKSNAATLPPGMSLSDGASNRNNIIYTTLVKDYKRELGLVLENRNDDSDSKSTWSNIVIAAIKPDSIAMRDGKLQMDDKLLSINGVDVTGIDMDRIMLMLEGTDRFIRIVVSRGDGEDPLGVALRNMPTRPSLGSWFSSTSNMSHRPSLIESYQRPTFGSVSSLQKQPLPQLIGTKPQKPPKPAYLVTKDSDEYTLGPAGEENPVAKPRSRSNGSLLSSQAEANSQMSDAERRAAWRRERLKSIEDDVEMAKLIAEAQRRRREEK